MIKKIPACTRCNPPDVVRTYESQGLMAKFLGKEKRNIVLMKRVSPYEFFCIKCKKFSRPDPKLEMDGKTKLWFVSCGKCGERHISPEYDKCVHCDLEEL